MIEISPLKPDHDFNGFDCGEKLINDFLKNESRNQQKWNISNIYVIYKDNKVIAYSALFSCHFRYKNEELNRKVRIPGICIGQLGVDKKYKKNGLGKYLIQHSISVANKIRKLVGCRIIYVEALENAKKYWERFNFKEIEKKGKNQFKMVFDINCNDE
ncbi:MAG: GNAT family N-acetyltransferase [Candidatus Lokiarchaeota archaeon]|nr:GNAT family N-acetyltransferase [Candidatus Harpocratesius repetitus]